MVQVHEIDMRTPEQLEQERIKEFIDEINQVQDKHQLELKPNMRYEVSGAFPIIVVQKRAPKEEPKPELKPEVK